jgi:hypothetical protein
MEKSMPLDVARNYYNSWTSKNFEEAGRYLVEDLRIIVPINHYASKQSFMDAVKYTAGLVTGVEMISSFGDENEAVLIYDMNINSYGKLRVAEHFKVRYGKITQLCQIHDTAPFRN